MKYNIKIYPPTSVVEGKETVDHYIESCADDLYNEWVCGMRFEPEDIKTLIDIGKKRYWEKAEK